MRSFICFFFFFFFSAQNASNNKSNHVRWLFWQLPIDDYMHATRRMSFSYIPTDVSATSALSLWLVMYCICLLTSLFIYRCLACNHGWHETPWCKLWRVNIPISLPAFAATETWIRASHVTHTSYWCERQQTGCSQNTKKEILYKIVAAYLLWSYVDTQCTCPPAKGENLTRRQLLSQWCSEFLQLDMKPFPNEDWLKSLFLVLTFVDLDDYLEGSKSDSC